MDLAETQTLYQAADKSNSEATSAQWYVVHSKPRQEARALANLTQQGYDCYLPLRRTEKIYKRGLAIVQEPLFPATCSFCWLLALMPVAGARFDPPWA